MNSRAKISIVFGTYKDPELIIPTLEGLRSQIFKDFVVYVVDDNDPDEMKLVERAKEIISGYSELDIHYIKNDINIGVPHVYRKWIDLVDSKYFYICGAGDVLLPKSLHSMINFLTSHDTASMVHGLEHFERSDKTTYEIKHPPRETGEYSIVKYLKFHLLGGKENLGWSQASAMYRTEFFKIKDIPITNYHFWDHYFHCVYLLHSDKIGFLNDYLAIRHVDSNLDVWAQQNTFTNRLARRVQTSKFIDEFEVLLIQKKYPINWYRLKNAIQIIKGIGYCHTSNEFNLASRVAISDLLSVLSIGMLRIVLYPLLKLFSLLRKY